MRKCIMTCEPFNMVIQIPEHIYQLYEMVELSAKYSGHLDELGHTNYLENNDKWEAAKNFLNAFFDEIFQKEFEGDLADYLQEHRQLTPKMKERDIAIHVYYQSIKKAE